MVNDKNDDIKAEKSNEDENQSKMTAAEERTEYFKNLEKWLHEAYAWQSVAAMFPYYLMSGQIINPTSGKNCVSLYSLFQALNTDVH